MTGASLVSANQRYPSPTEWQGRADLILLFVRKRIHCGIGRFCFAFFASTRLILNVFWDGCAQHTRPSTYSKPVSLNHTPIYLSEMKETHALLHTHVRHTASQSGRKAIQRRYLTQRR